MLRSAVVVLFPLMGCTPQDVDATEPSRLLPAPVELQVRTAQPDQLVLLSVGDTDVGNQGSARLEVRGPDSAFVALDPYLDADLGLVNLETTVTEVDPNDGSYDVHRMRPEWLSVLSERGLTVASVANNHTMDQGLGGLAETLDWLDTEGMAAVGAGRTTDEARRAVILDTGSIRVGIVGAFERRTNGPYEDGWYADRGGGVLPLHGGPLLDDLRALDEQVDVLVVSVHWGQNYVQESEELRGWARELVDAGVDLINGHGAHLVQGVEEVEGVPVIYSLGNFVFSSNGRYDEVEPELRLSVIARYVFDGRALAAIELLPIRTDNQRVDFAPVPAEEAQAIEQLLPQIERYGMSWMRRADGWYEHVR